ncbi:MAG: transposase, partial [Kofleriaceae bacterium]
MRAARRTVPSVVYHLIWRFADRSFALAAEDERERYLELLGRALATTDWRCLGYALMPDRLQLAMVAGRAELSSWSRVAHSPFVRWMNHRRRRHGALIADRPIGHAVPADYEGTLLAHLHGDPVRAGQVAAPLDSAWTSHRAYAGLVAPPPWLHVSEGLRRAGFADAQGFDAWVCEALARSGELDRERCRRELRRQARLDAAMVVPPGHAVRRV